MTAADGGTQDQQVVAAATAAAAALLTENVTQKRACVSVSASASVSATVMFVGKRADTVLAMQ